MRQLAIVIVLFSLAGAAPAQIFPVEPGVKWAYEAQIVNSTRNRLAGGATIKWTSELVKTLRVGDSTASIIRGFPFDLTWYDPARQERYTVMVQNKRGIWLQTDLSLSDAEAIAKKSVDAGKSQKQLLRLPIRNGDCISDDGIMQPKRRWCWSVEGKVKDKRGEAWQLVRRDNSGQEVLYIVPKIGIVRYAYDHHGTPASANAKLVSMKRK